MDATTMRASTVMRSIPTSETRTHASITIPLSRTRSRTSIRLVPPAVRSMGIEHSLCRTSVWVRALSWRRRSPARQRRQLSLERADLLAQLVIFCRQRLFSRRQMVVVFPPVETDLLRLVDRADEQADPDREQLDFGERNFD